jgi:hypothetical protein
VTFHLKTDPRGALQSGLIAEEVAKVYPELVIRDQNEAQEQAATIRDLKQQMAELKALNQATQLALRKLEARDQLVARR